MWFVEALTQSPAPQPWLVLLVTSIASIFWHALLALLWRFHPSFAEWPLVLLPLLGAGTIVLATYLLLRKWTAMRGWNDRHRLALASGALLSHSLMGGVILTKTMTDRIVADWDSR